MVKKRTTFGLQVHFIQFVHIMDKYMGEMRNVFKILVGKRECKRPLGRHSH